MTYLKEPWVKKSKVDAYILRSAAFAQPILTYLRDVVHQVCPDAEEKIKWGFPHFDYLDDMMCSGGFQTALRIQLLESADHERQIPCLIQHNQNQPWPSWQDQIRERPSSIKKLGPGSGMP